MDCTTNFPIGQDDDDPFDLPPVAEAKHIPPVAARFGPRRGLKARIIAINFKQLRSIGKRHTVIDEERVHAAFVNPA